MLRQISTTFFEISFSLNPLLLCSICTSLREINRKEREERKENAKGYHPNLMLKQQPGMVLRSAQDHNSFSNIPPGEAHAIQIHP